MKKVTFGTSIITAPVMMLCGLLISSGPAAAQSEAMAADGPCSNATISGNYGDSAQGVLIGVPGLPAEAQFHSVGLTHFDGHGNFKGLESTVVNGVRMGTDWVANSGTYTVNPNCTGSLTLTTPNSPVPITILFVVVKQGGEFYSVESGDGINTVFTRVH